MSSGECNLSKSFKDGFRRLLEHQYVDTPELIKQGAENITRVIESNSRTFSTSVEGISADQKRVGDNLDKHIVDVERNFQSLLTALISTCGGRSARSARRGTTPQSPPSPRSWTC